MKLYAGCHCEDDACPYNKKPIILLEVIDEFEAYFLGDDGQINARTTRRRNWRGS